MFEKKVMYLERINWQKLVYSALMDGKMWMFQRKGEQEQLIKADENRRYLTYIATPISDAPNTMRVEVF